MNPHSTVYRAALLVSVLLFGVSVSAAPEETGGSAKSGNIKKPGNSEKSGGAQKSAGADKSTGADKSPSADETAAKIDPDKVPVAKDDKDDQSFEEMSGKAPAKKPGSLSKRDKEATVKRVRTLAGVEKSNLAAVPPALITLSPDNLSQGKSWLGMLKGAIRPKSSEKDAAYMTIGPKDGVFLLHYEPMVSGSPYLLDCEVAANPDGKMIWEVHGAFNGVVEDQEGHLLIGFIAADKTSNLSLSRHSGVALGHLFKCELTRVD